MSEVPATEEVKKAYTRADLDQALASPAFQGLEPNYDQKDTLYSQELTVDVIEAVTDKILSLGLVERFREIDRDLFSFQEQIPRIGTLEYIGGGESKLSFLLSTRNGKVVVHLAGYDGSLGVQVPTDPKIYMAKEMLGKRRAFYSDLRTYMILPVSICGDAHYGIMFQEYGQRPARLTPLTSRVDQIRVRRYIHRYAEQEGYPGFKIEDEVRHSRHHFLINGRVVFIDVEIIFNKG
ncbi:hypothetical protein JW766_04630 [Candidatus Dojkabacteria bacterium]|nr:hypothetical protein [Candidatus Dojkabacteria bacterium]